ncbi:hypothetical protein [uncultured Oscillibacter sp.]|uniref:hypothetical protein n=1 Tax=uncultured Oscillibacter sp. TaxID=876091 RepID=UPI0025DAB899|nr:hypothetical protein [uncultured Oscillibacter sp.]
MREYQDRIRPGALVVIAVSPMTLFYEPPDGQFEEQQPRYYRILSPWNIVDVDLGRSLRGRSSPGSMARSIWTIPGPRSLPGAATLTGT